MRYTTAFLLIIIFGAAHAQLKPDLKNFDKKNGASAIVKGNILTVSWPAGPSKTGKLVFGLSAQQPVFKSIELQEGGKNHPIASDLDPSFVLTVGKRELTPEKGWNIFFDKVPNKPFKSHNIDFIKRTAAVSSLGTRTVITLGTLEAPGFSGSLEITLYHGSPLVNIAAVMSTDIDSTAILYDGGLISKTAAWEKIGWSSVDDQMQSMTPAFNDWKL